MFKSKGALLVLLWTLNSFTVLVYPNYFEDEYFVFYFAVSLVSFPIAGLLADVFLSRYKVISYSLRLLCACTIFYDLLVNIEGYVHVSHYYVLKLVVGILTTVALSGVLTNVVSLGIDQQIDAPSSELCSFISWTSWTFFLGNSLIIVPRSIVSDDNNMHAVWTLILLILSTLSVVCDILLNHWLLKEPTSKSSLKLIYQVLKYAVKNKHPRLLSAFTYWEDKPFSRIDLGKSKYGGPFTTEQVEDVKTFFRIHWVTTASSLTAFVVGVQMIVLSHGIYHYRYSDSSTSDFKVGCYAEFIRQCSPLAVVIFVPVMELIVCPFLKILSRARCTSGKQLAPEIILRKLNPSRISIMQKITIGMFFLLTTICFNLGSEVVGLRQNLNYTVACIVHSSESYLEQNHVLQINYTWLLIPQIFTGISNYLLIKGLIEFISAQSPYSMRGLLFGIIFYACILPLSLSSFLLDYLGKVVSDGSKYCSMWFYCGQMAVTLLLVGVWVIVRKCYTPRRRDEDLHNRQMFAENYYEKYLENASSPNH